VATEVERRWGVPRDQISMIPLAVDTERFRPASDRDRHDWRVANRLADEDLVLVAVGRFAPSKRFDDAIRVLARVRERGHGARLVLIGDGGERSRLEELAQDLGCGDAVHLVGPRFDQDLAAAVAASDVLLSCSEYEGFGLTIIEAMACGTPVVAAAVGGVTDLVVDGVTGYLVGVGEVGEMADRVQSVLDGGTAAMSSAARRRAEDCFSLERFAAAFADLYRRVSEVDGRHAR
jgi:glycosyltransferase involved in cell wall biosynthesis